MGSGGGGGTNTVQKADPWSGVQDYLAGSPTTYGLYQRAYDWLSGSNPQYFPGQTVASPDWSVLDAENRGIERARNGSPLEKQAQQYFSDVAGGKMLANDPTAAGSYVNGNPYLTGMVDAAAGDVTRNFKNAVMPSIASQFATGGRYGSGQQLQGINDANFNLAQRLSNQSTTLRGQAYNFERGLQENAIGRERGYQTQAAGMLPGMASIDWNNIAQEANIGAQRTARRQGEINSDISRWDYNQNIPLTKLSNFSQLLQGFGGGQQSSSQSQNGGFLSNALGGAMLGNSIYGLGANAGLWGGAAGLGAMGSLGLGSGALFGGGAGLAATGALGGVSAGTSLFSTAAPLMALAL